MSKKFNYNEKRKQILDEAVGVISNNSNMLGYIDMELVNNLLDSLKTRRPVTPDHVKYKKYETLFESTKQYDKFITTAQCLTDIHIGEDLINTGKLKLLTKMNFQEVIKVLDILVEKKISAHNFFSNIPAQISYPELWPQYITKILSYSIDSNTLFKLILVSNHKRMLTSNNKDEVLNNLAYLETKQALSLSGDTTASPDMILSGTLDDPFCRFTKSASDITSIGSRTFCCFKKGGVGQPLMYIALKSPIAAIIEGTRANKTWFAYIWELVEFNEKTKTFDINLVLDNIEANNRLSIEEYYHIIEQIEQTKKYKKVYLGYCRNDIEIPNSVIKTRKLKSRGLPFYAKELQKYQMYDDSKYVYTCLNREVSNEFSRRPLTNNGDFHRIKYIIDVIKDTPEVLRANNLNFKWNEDSYFFNNKMDRRFNVYEKLDLEKSFIVDNYTTIKAFELYDKQGELLLKYNTDC